MSKKSRFRGPIDNEHGKRAIMVLKSASQQFYHIYWSFWSQLSCKKCLLSICQILGLFANILAINDKYPCLNRKNITKAIEIQLSHKQKAFCGFFSAFFKFRLNFEHFLKKNDRHRFSIFEITESTNVVR